MAKSLFVQVGEAKGKKQQGQFTFTHQYAPASEELKNSRGSLYAIASLYEEDEASAVKNDREIFQTLQASYFSSSVGGVLAALETAFEQTLKTIEEKAANSGSKPKFDLAVAVLWGEALYLVKTQNTGVVFQRGSAVKELKFNKTASGSVKDSDNILLVNKRFIEQVEVEDIVPPLKKEDFKESTDALNSLLSQKEGVEALLLRVYVEEPKQQAVEMVEVEEKEGARLMNRLAKSVGNILKFLAPALSGLRPYVNSFLGTASVYFSLAFNKILEPWRSREPGSIEDPTKRRRARAAQIAVVLILLLVLSVGLALMNRENSARQAELEEKLGVVEGTLTEIENLADINPERAEELLVSVEATLSEAKGFEIESDKLKDLDSRYKLLAEKVKQIYSVSLEEFYTFQNFSITSLVKADKQLIVLDKESSKIYSVDIESKKERQLPSEGKVNQIAVSDNNLYLQTDSGVKKLNLDNLSVADVQGAYSDWGSLVDADTYRQNLYLLDSKKGEVWKYLAAGDSLSSAQTYFKGKPKGELSAMAIDGLIWLGNKQGEISKFLAGRQQKFEISGLDKPLGEIADIFTTEGSNALFILDKSNNRVVGLDKGGSYVSQNASDEFGAADGLVADEKSKTVYVSVGGSIKQFKYK